MARELAGRDDVKLQVVHRDVELEAKAPAR
jgi:hypothetical protein